MTHSISTDTPGLMPILVTIINYVTGGEAFTAAEFNVPSISSVMLGNVSPAQNSLGVPLFPILVGGKVKLFQFVSGAPVEIPTTTALNAVIDAILFVA